MALFRNAGVGGNDTAAMLARLDSDVLAYGTSGDWVIVQGGGNDITNGRTTAQITADLAAIYTALSDAGREVVASTVLPSTYMDTTAEQDTIVAVNAWIRANYASYGAMLCDWNPAMSDTNEWTPKAGYTSDGVHPNATGAAVMAGVLDDVILANAPAAS